MPAFGLTAHFPDGVIKLTHDDLRILRPAQIYLGNETIHCFYHTASADLILHIAVFWNRTTAMYQQRKLPAIVNHPLAPQCLRDSIIRDRPDIFRIQKKRKNAV